MVDARGRKEVRVIRQKNNRVALILHLCSFAPRRGRRRLTRSGSGLECFKDKSYRCEYFVIRPTSHGRFIVVHSVNYICNSMPCVSPTCKVNGHYTPKANEL